MYIAKHFLCTELSSNLLGLVNGRIFTSILRHLLGMVLIKFVNLYMYNCEIDYGASQGAELERN